VPTLGAQDLRELGRALLARVGIPDAEARLVADHLVESGLRGHDTHSVLRLPQYVNMVRDQVVVPGARLEVLEETPYAARVSGGWNFGPVTATQAVQLAMEKVRRGGVAAVGVRDCNHVARLGRFAALAAEQNLICLMVANGHGGDLAVAPFGGRDRRLPTNPICLGIPTGREWPVLVDMTTSMVSGGDLRLWRNRGDQAPPGALINAAGEPTRKIEEYYGPPAGAILPLGFPGSGHKGFGLGVLVDILAGTLSGAGCSQAAPPRPGNALFLAVLRVEAFAPLEEFFAEVQRFISWVKACPPGPGFGEVLLPGERAHRQYLKRSREGLYVDEAAWAQIGELASELGVALPAPVAD
jgi:uncharacterized oxidoreductase